MVAQTQPVDPTGDENRSSNTESRDSLFFRKTEVALSETKGLSDSFRKALLQFDAGTFDRIAHAGGILRRKEWPCGLDREHILQTAEGLWQKAPNNIGEFLISFQAALPVLSKKEINKWIDYGFQLLEACPQPTCLSDAYFRVSPVFFSARAFSGLDSWVLESLRIVDISLDSACHYLEKTPEFAESDSLLHLREWGGMIREILVIQPDAEQTVLGFMESSIGLLQKISYRIYQSWYAAGIRLMRKSPAMGGLYFSTIPKNMRRLYQTEMRKIFDLTAGIAKELPGKAVEFYQSSAELLLGLNPNVREKVLDVAKRISKNEPARMQDSFNRIVRGIESLSYPDQETVVKNEADVGTISKSAAGVYFDNAATLLKSVRGPFFSFWVAEGCLRLAESEQKGIDYFAFKSAESRAALAKWKEAVFLEELEKQLTIYARALCGRAIRLKPQENNSDDQPALLGQSPEEGGDVLFLPSYVAEEADTADNFRIYKVTVAHQAGYIEFGTFGPGYEKIEAGFKAFPFPELIRDIFFILENGRIDRCLRGSYKGLCSDLDRVLETQMSKRAIPGDSPLHEALEALLRLVYGCLAKADLPERITAIAIQLEGALSNLYTPQITIRDIFLRAVVIHDIMKPLFPKEAYIPFQTFDFLEMPDLEMMSEGAGDEIGDKLKSGEESDGYGVELSEEEMEKLIEMLKDISTLEPIKKGEGGKGFVIEGLTAQVTGELEELSDDDPKPEEKVVVTGGLSKLTTRKGPFFYDEWDYLQKSYRNKWCCLREVQVEPAATDLYEKIYSEYSDLIRDVKRQFQRIRPEELEQIKRLEWGSEIDFNAMIQNVVDRKIGDTPSDRIFSRREKKRRRISTFLLIDMSASTDRMASSLLAGSEAGTDSQTKTTQLDKSPDDGKRIIDIEIESLVVMAEALESLDDSYAIFGFSGYGREQVELFSIKDFSDPYSQETKNRICGIQPRKSTRMGPAIRHASSRLKESDSDHQLLIMLSDGYPQDMNYGEDRTSQTYALHDTMMALIESKRAGIRPFCITIDQCGDDYLRKMIDPGSYLVIKDIYSLPSVLPRVVESLMG